MSVQKILKTGLRKRGADGLEAIVFIDGDERSTDERWAEVRKLVQPKVELGCAIWLEDGTKVTLPFTALPWILPDRTGVLVLFESGEYTHQDGTDVFAPPNNAAIYNADGSLRFQLRFPAGDFSGRIGGIHSGSMPDKFEGMMGVVAGSAQGMPEWVYAVDPNSPELISTGQWVRW
ncbi:MAG: hypothetical protein EPO09_00635 [Aquabacterium sp.]|uniref:hypothetical protein n=1 Tax=Aquabacterium sp. TaxID=1872578 RepID=UPI001227E319|nr:hypothetical protein [Aquabacterium sp.]TAK99771.1 MAG: hypothetical protein EPO09_00635 [Aquabacterium sp.]